LEVSAALIAEVSVAARFALLLLLIGAQADKDRQRVRRITTKVFFIRCIRDSG
jgi:hypothetical protein